jgi:RNA polymerase subunit RPABC4/transcription elongation factor Spt4
MAMIHCSECKKPISDQADKCPSCGAPRTTIAQHQFWVALLISGVFVAILWQIFMAGK